MPMGFKRQGWTPFLVSLLIVNELDFKSNVFTTAFKVNTNCKFQISDGFSTLKFEYVCQQHADGYEQRAMALRGLKRLITVQYLHSTKGLA